MDYFDEHMRGVALCTSLKSMGPAVSQDRAGRLLQFIDQEATTNQRNTATTTQSKECLV